MLHREVEEHDREHKLDHAPHNEKADMSHIYVEALKGVLIFCWVINTLHNVITCIWTSPVNGMKKQLKFEERIKVKFKLNRMN